MSEELVVIISITAIFNMTLIAILSWLKFQSWPSNFWLGMMTFAVAWAVLDNILMFQGIHIMAINHFAIMINLLWGTYLIEFIRSLKSPERKTIRFNFWLYIPLFLYIPFLIVSIFNPNLQLYQIKKGEEVGLTLAGNLYNLCLVLYSVLANLVLLIQTLVQGKKKHFTENQYKILVEFLGMMLLMQLSTFALFIFDLNFISIILIMPIISQLFYLYLFVRFTISTAHLFTSENVEKKFENVVKYSNIKIDENELENIRQRIVEHVTNKSPYLQPDYNINRMSKEINIHPHVISMIINSKLNTSFREYINSFRIKKSIELLDKIKKNHYTIETILYESGFNNRTSFYTAFKKEIGKLPLEYLKEKNEIEKDAVIEEVSSAQL